MKTLAVMLAFLPLGGCALPAALPWIVDVVSVAGSGASIYSAVEEHEQTRIKMEELRVEIRALRDQEARK